MPTEIVSEVLILPDGCPPDNIDATTFGIKVAYRGHYVRRSAEAQGVTAWYAVEHMGSSLSRAGNWGWMIDRFQRWQYRFSFAEAMDWARSVVNDRKVNGRTWAEWEQSKQGGA